MYIRGIVAGKAYLYLCTIWLSRLKQRTAHTRRRVGRQIGTVHEAKLERCVDDGAGFRVAPLAHRATHGLAIQGRVDEPLFLLLGY